MPDAQPLDLDAIKARASAATSGPWEHSVTSDDQHLLSTARLTGEFYVHDRDYVYDKAASTATAEFIAHAREDVPALVAEVERLRAQVAAALHVADMCEALNFKLDAKGTADVLRERVQEGRI